jgi:hypothetical protein
MRAAATETVASETLADAIISRATSGLWGLGEAYLTRQGVGVQRHASRHGATRGRIMSHDVGWILLEREQKNDDDGALVWHQDES